MENILEESKYEKKRIEYEKNEDENYELFK